MTYSGAAVAYRTASGLLVVDPVIADRDGNEAKFPSRVFVADEGDIAVGQQALDQEIDGVPGNMFQLFKRYLGTSWSESGPGAPITATTLTKGVIVDLKRSIDLHLREIGVDATNAVRYTFTYPGMWQESELNDFNQAIQQAGFPDGSYDVLQEPLATVLDAATASTVKSRSGLGALGHILVCDLGGGTLDLAVVVPRQNGAVAMKAGNGGDTQLGMSNLDKYLGLHIYLQLENDYRVREVVDKYLVRGPELDDAWHYLDLNRVEKSQLLRAAELLKRNICDTWAHRQPKWGVMFLNSPAVIDRPTMERVLDSMYASVRAAIESYLQQLEASKVVPGGAIRSVVLGGGGCNLPEISTKLNSWLGVEVIRTERRSAALMVQRGAAQFALNPSLIRERRFDSSYGIKTFIPLKPNEVANSLRHEVRGEQYHAVYRRFFERHSVIPERSITRAFTPLEDGQPAVQFDVLQGECEDPIKNHIVRTMELPLPEGADHTYEVRCSFFVGSDGLIHVVVLDPLDPKARSREVAFEWNAEDET